MKKTFRNLFFVTALMALMTVLFCFGASAATSGGYEYLVLNDNTVAIINYSGTTKNLVIPDKIAGKTVTRIGTAAFSGCENLTSVTIPAGVTSIFDLAFGSGSLTSIYVDSGNKNYSSDSYGVMFNKNKTKLIQYPIGNTRTSYTIPSGVTSIGDWAFTCCDSLKNVTIPSGVTSIGDYAFYYCDSLKNITIPANVTNIGTYAFGDCYRLTSIYVDSGNKKYSSDSYGVLFNKSKTELVQYPTGNTRTSYTIPSGVTSIGDGAFDYCYSLKNITIPSGVRNIGGWAFAYCENLTGVTIPAGVRNIGEKAFSGCDFKSITIPSSVASIGEGAFEWCSSLTGIYVDSGNKNYYSDSYGVLFNKNKTELVQYPIGNTRTSYAIPSGVTSIGEGAFYGCYNLKSITIPDSVVSIGNEAFNGTAWYENQSDGLRYIGKVVYEYKGEMPENTSIVIKPGTKSIADAAFSHCNGLTSITIPDSVTNIGDDAFTGCSNLTNIYVDSGNKNYSTDSYGVLFNKNKTKLIKYPEGNTRTSYSIPYGVTSIDAYAFDEFNKLAGIKMPSSVTSIGDSSFYLFCGNIYYAGTLTDWKKVSIGRGNLGLREDNIYYHTHSYTTTVTKKATTTTAGSKTTTCDCEYVKTQTIPAVTSITLSANSYVYDGKNKTPTVTVKDSKGKKLVKNTDYKLTVASKRSAIGTYTVKVTLMGNYSGSKTLSYDILPGATTAFEASAHTTKTITFTWNEVAGATGYRLFYKLPTATKWKTIKDLTALSYKVKGLTAGTKYVFAVRPYYDNGSKKVFSKTYLKLNSATCTETPTIKLASTAVGRATVAWTDVIGETGYQVYYSATKTGGYKKAANHTANTTKVYHTGFTSGKTYYFKVRSYIKTDSGYVYSPFSAVKSVKIK